MSLDGVHIRDADAGQVQRAVRGGHIGSRHEAFLRPTLCKTEQLHFDIRIGAQLRRTRRGGDDHSCVAIGGESLPAESDAAFRQHRPEFRQPFRRGGEYAFI